MKQSSSTIKRISLELGGNAPFVVFEDADVDQAVAAAISSKYRNAGQTCVCSDRFLIHEAVHDEFVTKLVEKVECMKVGPGSDVTTTIGPLSKCTTEYAQSLQGVLHPVQWAKYFPSTQIYFLSSPNSHCEGCRRCSCKGTRSCEY